MAEIGSGTGSSYPSALDTDASTEVNSPALGKTKARAEVANDLAAAIIAIQTELGTDPAGSKTDVKTFLQTEHNTDGTHMSSGSSFWTTVAGTPTRVSNTQFTITDTGGANGYADLLSKGVCLKWTKTTTKQAMIISSSYATNAVTINIIGDILEADFSAMKYGAEKAREVNFAVAGTLGTGTDLTGQFYAGMDMKIFGADARVATAGTTNSNTFDINDDGTTMFTTKPYIATTATAGVDFTADDAIIALEDSKITVDIDGVSTTAPVDAYIKLYWTPNKSQYLAG